MTAIALPARHEAATSRLDTCAAEAIAFAVLFATVLFLPQILNDGDTLWQIRAGEWILDHRAIPATDPFSFTAVGKTWFAHEWLAETLMALAWRMGGMAGVMALTAAAVGATGALLLRHLRAFLPGPYTVLGLAIALSNAAPSLLARPHVLAWPCLVLWCGGLAMARARRESPPFWLLPVMAIWVNLHGSFMGGLLLAFAFAVEALFDADAHRRAAALHWARFLSAALLCALANPEGPAGLLFPFQHLGMTSLAWIGEWQPTDFSRLQPLELMVLAGLALGLSGKVTLPPMRLLMLLALIHGALSHSRNEQLLGLVGAIVLAQPLGACLGRGNAGALLGWRVAVLAAPILALAALGARAALPLAPERTGAAFAATLARVPPDLRARPVLNDYSLGGDLIFQGVRPFVDSRADLHGDAFLTRYRAATASDRTALRRLLTEHAIAWTIFPAKHPIVAALDQEPGWRRLMETGGTIVHTNAP